MSALRVVQVGAGLWGRSWAELVRDTPGFELVALADARAAARDWATTELGVPAFARLEAALRRVPADVVLVASPPDTHVPCAELALAAGAHVLVEKPLARSLAEARRLAEAGAAAGRVVMVSQNYRFRRQARALQALLADDVLGALLGIRIVFRRDLRLRELAARDWRARQEHPLLLDMTIHHVDLLRVTTGRELVEVDARSWPVPDAPFRHDPVVGALLTLEGGVPVVYDGSWASPWPDTSWNGDWELLGDRGRARWLSGIDDALRGRVELERDGLPPARVALPRLRAVDRRAVLVELATALREDREPECSARDNLRSLAGVLAMAQSTVERRPVAVAEVLA